MFANYPVRSDKLAVCFASVLLAYFIHIPVLLFLAWLLYKRYIQSPLRQVFWPALVAKLAAGIVVGLLYAYHYTEADTYVYFTDAVQLGKVALHDLKAYVDIMLFDRFFPVAETRQFHFAYQPRAFFMVKLLSLVVLFTLNQYWISSLYLSFISFCGMWSLAHTVSVLFPNTRMAAAVGFLFFPSVVFWSSGILKESIAMGCICFFLSLGLDTYFRWWPSQLSVPTASKHTGILLKLFAGWLVIPFILYIAWMLKFYYTGLIVPIFVAFVITDSFTRKIQLAVVNRWSPLLVMLLFTGFLSVASLAKAELTVPNFLQSLYTNSWVSSGLSAPDGQIHYDKLQPTPQSFLKNTPLAFFSGLFRPLIWEGNHVLQWYVGTENLILAILCVWAVVAGRRLRLSTTEVLVLVSVLLYISSLATLLAFASPNFGTLSRYRVGFLPLLVYLVLIPVRLPFFSLPQSKSKPILIKK
jgi:hypothetical protein